MCNGTDENEPPGRYRHEVGFDGRKIYILAGGTASNVFGFRHVPAFDVEKKKWTKEKTIPAPKFGKS